MRTLSEMKAMVRRHVRGAENLTWSQDDYEAALVEAARTCWRQAVNRGTSRFLHAWSEEMQLPAGGYVDLPSDCLKLEEVYLQVPHHLFLCQDRWEAIQYLKPTREHFMHHVYLRHWDGIGWTEGEREGTIRIVGIPPGATLKLLYDQQPIFPFEESGTLRNPSGQVGAPDTYPAIPELADTTIEYLAAAILLGEEVKDGDPIGYCGQQYASYMRMMCEPLAKPARKYVRRVSGRR